jgi:hypothetical protein
VRTHDLLQGAPRWAPGAGEALRAWLRWTSDRTGLPAIVVAAVALTTSWYLLKRAMRFAVGVAISTALLIAATRLGWISW